MSLKCNDREGQERHFQAGKAEPGGPRCTTLALRQLENLCFFIQIICWVPLISFSFRALGSLNNDIVMKDSHKYPHKQLFYEQQL